MNTHQDKSPIQAGGSIRGVARRRIDGRLDCDIYPPPHSSHFAPLFPRFLVSQPTQKPLTAAEIETLLRAARERLPSVRSDAVSNEPLGPGDVQHFQNTAISKTLLAELAEEDGLADFAWPGLELSADERLHQVDQQLAEGLSTRSDSLGAPSSVANSVGQSFAFAPFDQSSSAVLASGVSLESLGDIELDISLELGRAEVTIEELLQLREGSVVSLNKAADEPIDILANGRLVARGEVIVVEGKFGVRLCEVIGQ